MELGRALAMPVAPGDRTGAHVAELKSLWIAVFSRRYDSAEIEKIRGKPWKESIAKATAARKQNAAERRKKKK